MKTTKVLLLLTGFCISLSLLAQNKKDINEICNGNDDCKPGLYCVTLKDGTTKKCSSCDQDELDGYTAEVDKWCHGNNGTYTRTKDLKDYFGSKKSISLMDINKRKEVCKKCLTARINRERECWNGGDQGHKDEIDKVKDALNYLEGVENEARRNNLGFTCDEDKYSRMKDAKERYCKDVKQFFEKYGLDDGKEGKCDDIEDVIDKCSDCKKYLEDWISDCYRNGTPDDLKKELEEVRDMEKIAKETLDAKKRKNLCK